MNISCHFRMECQNVYMDRSNGSIRTMAWERDMELVGVVNRRADLLAVLEDSQEKRDLLEVLEVSRSTLDRAIRELESLGLVARDDGYQLTATGQLVCDLFERFLADLEDVAAAEELLRPLPPDVPISPVLLRGATVEIAEPPSPVQALAPIDDLMADCDRAKGLAVAATRPGDLLDRFERRVEDGARFEWVFTPEMADYFRANHAETMAALRDTGRFDSYVREGLPYGLGLVVVGDRHYTYVTLYDDAHTVRGAIVTDGIEAYSWAEHVYESYREEAAPMGPM